MIVIIGGGLAGMSTAYHLGEVPHTVLEADGHPGGLCRSRELNGFVFDYTGHLLHLRDPRIVELVDLLLPDAFETVARKARIRTHGATLPFPFQANLHGLPKEIVARCLIGFVESLATPVPEDPATSFAEWSHAVFGKGISDCFMLPYNCKLFCRDAEAMTADWVSWAVPKPSLAELIRGALGIRNEGMGYNSTFRYPKEGGIGVLPRALAERVPTMRTGVRVEAVDLSRRRLRLSGGEELAWDRLVVTSPLPGFLRMLEGGPSDLPALADRLDWSVVGCLNLGVNRESIADGAHWIYMPDDDVPFYRVGFPSNFSKTVAPAGTSSMYIEFGMRRGQTADPAGLERVAVEVLQREGILSATDRVVASDFTRIEPGYVIFDRARQQVMERAVPALEEYGVHLIGRYGAWTYSYMERALLDGLELAGRLRREAGLPAADPAPAPRG